MKQKEGYDESKRKETIKETEKRESEDSKNTERNKETKTEKDNKSDKVSDKINQYQYLSLTTCIQMAQAMGVPYTYGDYMTLLIQEESIEQIVKKINKEFELKPYTFEEYGYDKDLFTVLLKRIQKTLQSDFSNVYNQGIVEVMKQIKDFSKKHNVNTIDQINSLFKVDLLSLWKQFKNTCYQNIKDLDQIVKYENFVFEFLSIFKEIYKIDSSNILMDIADLYILCYENEKGDRYYSYLIQNTDKKENCYLRWATIYCENDMDMARTIAKKGLSAISSSSEKYSSLLEILVRNS